MIGFAHIVLCAEVTYLLCSFILDVIRNGVSVSTAEKDVARTIIMDDLLDDLSLVVFSWGRLGRHSLHAKHWLDWYLILEVRWCTSWYRPIQTMW